MLLKTYHVTVRKFLTVNKIEHWRNDGTENADHSGRDGEDCRVADRREARLNQDEAPIYCDMPKGHMAQLRYTGKGPRFYKPTARTVIYKVGDLDDWINASARTSTAEAAA